MADYIIQDTTLTAIADSIRAKTGSTDKIAVVNMASEIDSIEQGSGGVGEGCVTVTFVDGDEVPLSRPVYIGDDCPDPVTQGRFAAPTKESTVDKVYTYSGWTSVDGGTADSNVLKNIRSDTVVYSAFEESVRYYTVNFYDGETLLNTEQVAYGGSSSYSYKKDNFLFNGWNPEPSNITSDLNCYGEWEESYTFADASWEYISRMSESGRAEEVFNLGDEKDIVVNYADGTNETVTLHIAGFNKLYTNIDTNDNTKSETAGIALTAKHILKDERAMHSSDIRLEGFESSTLYTWLNDAFYAALPTDLQSVLKEHYSHKTSKYIDGAFIIIPHYAKVLIPATLNVSSFGGTDYKEALPLYNTKAGRIKTKRGSTSPAFYWLAYSTLLGSSNTYYIDTTGEYDNVKPLNNRLGICPLLAI